MKNPIDFFSDETARSGLREKTVKGAAVTGVTQLIRVAVGLATLPLLARMLDPSDFGLVATVAVVTNSAAMFVDAGLSMATVQRAQITNRQISSLFWIAAVLGLAITLLVSAVGPLLAWLYSEPRLLLLTIVCSTAYIFTGLTIQHQALLKRCMMFRRIAVVEIFSLTAGQMVALWWAWDHFGQANDYWAIALIPLVTAIARMLGTWIACPWIPGLPHRSGEISEMIRFGGNLTSGQALNYLAAYFDLLVVGYFFGDRMLGNYERSATLALQPVRQVNGPLTAVCVPALSRLVDRPKKYFHTYRTAATIIGMIIVPISAVCIVDADLIVSLLLGSGWEDCVPIFRVLSLGLIALPMCNSSSWLLISQGRGSEMFRYQAVDAATKFVLVCGAISWGVMGVAIACVIRLMLNPPFLFYLVGRKGSVSSKQIWAIFSIQLLAAAATVAVLQLMRMVSSNLSLYESITMAIVVAVITSTTVFSSFRFVRSGLLETLDAFRRLQPATP